jgi:hypothetical protein
LSTNFTRFFDYIQKNITVLVRSDTWNAPTFLQDTYKLQILDKTPVDTTILSLAYTYKNELNSLIQLSFEQLSNPQITNYFYLKYSPYLKVVYILIKMSPIPIEKPELNFVIRISAAKMNSEYVENNINSTYSSYAAISIRILSLNVELSSFYLNFIRPPIAHSIIRLNDTSLAPTYSASVIYMLEAVNINGPQSLVTYSLLNFNLNMFVYLINNQIVVNYEYIKQNIVSLRTSYLVNDVNFNSMNYNNVKIYFICLSFQFKLFIEARDLNSLIVSVAYTTIEIRLDRLIDCRPYFKRDINSATLQITLPDDYPLRTSFYDLTSIIYIPKSKPQLYFYIFEQGFYYR